MSFLFADTDADVAVTGTGAIPFCASWETTTTAPDFSNVNMAAYDTDELIFTNIIWISKRLPVNQQTISSYNQDVLA